MIHRNDALAGSARSVWRWRAARVAMTLAVTAFAAPCALATTPQVAVALRAGTPGVGLDLDLGLSRWFGVRVGYSAFDINHSVNTSDVDYSGKLKLAFGTALLDWYPFGGGFHLSAGAVANGTKLDVVGQPSAGSYTINGDTYTSQQIGSLSGELKFGNSVAPYVGFGWGNPAGTDSRWHLLLDLGAVYGGTPSVSLTAQCGPAAPQGSALCDQAQSDVVTEQQKLQSKASFLRWYPVVSLGVAVRF